MITATPTSFEFHDGQELLATATMFDEGGSEIEIKQIQNAATWAELAGAIQFALQKMHPEASGMVWSPYDAKDDLK